MGIEAREQGNLIGSDKVEGTNVYDAEGEKIGSIERVMIDKLSGKVSYAVLGFGGFLGIGDDRPGRATRGRRTRAESIAHPAKFPGCFDSTAGSRPRSNWHPRTG